MTEAPATSASLPAGPEPGIPGISGDELAVMLAGSRRFLTAQDASAAVLVRAAGDLAALTEPAGPLAAGLTSPLHDSYDKVQRTHFMLLRSAAR